MTINILTDILSQDCDNIIEEKKGSIFNIVKKYGESYILFGAGSLGKKALKDLRKIGIEPIAFVDNNKNLWGKRVEGLEVCSPENAANKFSQIALFVITIYTNQPVIRQLKELQVEFMTFATLAWYYSDIMLPHGTLDLPHQIFQEAENVQKSFELWHDEASRKEYISQIKWRTNLLNECLPPHLPAEQIYFPTYLLKDVKDECFVDCGAYNGDSINKFICKFKNRFKSIWAIEPDPDNFRQLQSYIKMLDKRFARKVIAVQAAVGSCRQKTVFDATGTAASMVGSGSYQVDSIPLDDILALESPTYIKMDIEGSEIEALIGAQKTIKKKLPVLAICAYHKQDHLWKIPKYIKSISDDYSLFLRRYSDECWELVCYAIPKSRLRVKREGMKCH